MTKALLKTLALGATLLLVSMGSTDIAQALAKASQKFMALSFVPAGTFNHY